MNNLTTPKAVLIGMLFIALSVFFRVDDTVQLVGDSYAAVAGMDESDLVSDSDFESAVEYIVENCTVEGDVDDGYLSDGSISC